MQSCRRMLPAIIILMSEICGDQSLLEVGRCTDGIAQNSCAYTKIGVGGGHLYRFIGQAGDALPITLGWLSGWGQPGHNDPDSITCATDSSSGNHDGKCPPTHCSMSGIYPTIEEPLSHHTVCFTNVGDGSGGGSCWGSVAVGFCALQRILLVEAPRCSKHVL